MTKFLRSHIENVSISYKAHVRSKHTCSITQQLNEDIHTHAKPKKINENDDFNVILMKNINFS